MSWVPPNLAQSCAVFTTITTCQAPTFMFLELVVRLFGQSRDAPQTRQRRQDQDPGVNFNEETFKEFLVQVEDQDYQSATAGPQDEFQNQEHEGSTFDFLVIGAGSAGCVVANRLTEVEKWNVLLLEAGIEEPEAADVPAFANILRGSNIDWGYQTQPQQNSCLAFSPQQCDWPRGRVMGGSSVLNSMIYLRSGPQDYDEWAQDNPGWSYKDVLPYFLKSENNPELGGTQYHATGGYLNVERFPYQDRPTLSMLDAFREIGLAEFDQNTPRQVGSMLMQHTTRDGERNSANIAFIRPIRNNRENLQLVTQAQVVRILIDPDTKTAHGVEYVQKGKIFRALARKEVILSAGTIDSPKLLMLSGVGPKQHLESLGIETIKDHPGVGQNLQDHTTADGVLFALPNTTATSVTDEQRTQDMYSYRQTRRGPLASTGSLQINAFIQTRYENEEDRPDIQWTINAANVQNFIIDPVLSSGTNVLPTSYYDGMMIRSVLLNPKSRGYIMLNSTDPIFGPPLIFANTFQERIDLDRMVDGIKISLNLLQTQALRKLGVTMVTLPLPGCQQFQFGSDDYWGCIIMQYTGTQYHLVGTCKMGPKQDFTAVVDNELKVHGINHLRVIDASVMPKVIRANTNAATIMIGEKGSDFIKEKWLTPEEKLAYSEISKVPTSSRDSMGVSTVEYNRNLQRIAVPKVPLSNPINAKFKGFFNYLKNIGNYFQTATITPPIPCRKGTNQILYRNPEFVGLC